MGQSVNYSDYDKKQFREVFIDEHCLLKKWFENHAFSSEDENIGSELEGQILNVDNLPANVNEAFIKSAHNPYLVTEVGQATVEINTPHLEFHGNALSQHEKVLRAMQRECLTTAKEQHVDFAVMGILMSVLDDCLFKKTPSARFEIMEKSFNSLRKYELIPICISAEETLCRYVKNLSLMCSTGAFQVHLQIKFEDSVRMYNAAQILAGPVLACAGNSPFLLGKNLWQETRIPLLEQMSMSKIDMPDHYTTRTNFGHDYIHLSLCELFDDNVHYPSIMPCVVDKPLDQLYHLRLHNGTIYRWNRPVIGFDNKSNPHLRIEYRMLPAGPSTLDMMANTALLLGATYALAKMIEQPEHKIPFSDVIANFYNAAKYGMNTQLHWYDGQQARADELLLKEIIPLAYQGLNQIGIDEKDAKYYLSIISERVHSMQTGSQWLIHFREKNKSSFEELVTAYLHYQKKEWPVHEWPLS